MLLHRVKKFVFSLGLSFAVLFLFPVSVMADTKSILDQYPLQSNSLFHNVLRSVGWSLISGLHWLVGGLETSIYSINDAIGGFFMSDAVMQLEQKIYPLVLALLVLVILFVGISAMFKPQNYTSIVGNLVIGTAVFISLPYLLSSAYSFTTQAVDYMGGSKGNISVVSNNILVDNITDTTRYDAENFKSPTLKYKNYFAKPGADTTKISGIDINELVDPDKMKYPDVWKNKLTHSEDGTTDLQELNSGKLGFIDMPMLSEYYYRWNVDWFTILTTLVVTAAALLLSGIKIARLLYELAINQTLAQVMALLDVYTAQRLKKCIQLLVSTLGTLFAVFFMLQMYILGTSYVSSQNINPFVRFLVMLALAFAVIDGPNLFEQIFGVDAGIRSGMRSLYGLKAAGGMVGGFAAMMGGSTVMEALKNKGLMGTAKGIIAKTGSFAGGLGGVAAGIAKGSADNRQRVAAVRKGFSSTADNPVDKAAEYTPGPVRSTVSTDSVKEGKSFVKSAEGDQTAQGQTGTASAPKSYKAVSSNFAPDSSAADRYVKPINYQEPTVEKPENNTGIEEAQKQENARNAAQKADEVVSPGSIGEYVRSRASMGLQKSSPYITTKRMYSLTRGTIQKHGDKKVARAEQRLQSQRGPIVKPSKPIVPKSTSSHPTSQQPINGTWAQQEVQKEHMQEKGDFK